MMLERAAVSRETLIFHWPVMQFITQMMQEWSQSGEANHPIICIQIKMEFFYVFIHLRIKMMENHHQK